MIVCEVAQTFVRQVDGLVVVEVGGQIIEATAEHPFWVVGSGWIAAKNLKVGYMLQTLDGDTLPVEDVCPRPGLVTVYNFEVTDAHDYFISDVAILVHNSCRFDGVDVGEGYKLAIDKGQHLAKEGGFHGHILKDGEEVAKITGKGNWMKQHAGEILKKPSQFSSAVRGKIRSIFRATRKSMGL